MSAPPFLSQRAVHAGKAPIADLMHRALANPDLISLAAGFVDPHTLPAEPVADAMERLRASPERTQDALQYGTNAGYAPLREAIISRMQELDGEETDRPQWSPSQVVLSAGSNQLLFLLTDTLVDPGDIILCTSPTYFVYLGIAHNLRARAEGVESDAEGIVPEALQSRLEELRANGELSKVKAVYLSSYFDNPRGTTLPVSRRQRLVEILRHYSENGHHIHLLEDIAYRELRYQGPELPSVASFDAAGEIVIQIGTFSKSFSPGMRIGWACLPEHLVEPVLAQKGNLDFGSPNLNQHLMAEVLAGGDYEPHLQRLRARYAEKLEAMAVALEEHLGNVAGVRWDLPQGGLYVWLELPESVDAGPESRLMQACIEQGVLYVPGEYCFAQLGIPARRNSVRLSFGVQEPARLRKGVQAFATALQAVTEEIASAR